MQSNIYSKTLFLAALAVFSIGVLGLGLVMLLKSPSGTAGIPTNTTGSVPSNGSSVPTVNSNPASSNTSTTSSTSGYTTSELAIHNSSSSCWLGVDGGVYDVTKYIASGAHRAGNAIILEYCGQDASSVFSVHNSSGYNTLAQYLIGNLK